ncbi:MAG: MarR family winged helix-turn-helix transcriptional regulator [Beijerinckiaceae bacterium]
MDKVSPGISLDRETRAALRPGDHKAELRLWLRLLTCGTLIESGVRKRLRSRFDVTLPRFDLMAQLEKTKEGLTLGALSRRMMVSNGNITAIVEALLAQGLIERRASEHDRRAQVVSLTDAGRSAFAAMAAEHEDWIAEAFAGLSAIETEELMGLLAKLKTSARAAFDGEIDS